jgi:hypothetical protein
MAKGYIKTGAEFSKDRIHRYALYRIWDESKPLIMFIGLNPSTADENKDDPTIKRCVAFAKHWGYRAGNCLFPVCNLHQQKL